ncbi:gluconate operon transcriptional repressor GntR [Reinekea blandensis]|uniref:Gluconate utilization system Gnt-I transcriptional repressor n=1 Tax=Reinekea blandensis MED297 TaxID=314283 RepID=A4BHF7_9GAMM|nr:gluconate operon transcriptional repressor GntR [Reinekea blandensis]EAR08505.1 gluconate utilization system Gnt-I transcriptional repressor [Reinekea sp. MED297] [Reinekea blandensis MED297]
MTGKQKQLRPSLQHVADEVGTTKMTISRYLKDPELVSEALGKKISAALDKVGYIPNKAPGILSKNQSHSIGVLVPSLTNQVFSEVIREIEQVLEQHGYQPMLAHYGYSKDREEDRITTLLSYNVDGLILSESHHTEKVRKMIKVAGIPVVEIMDSVSPPMQQAIGYDNAEASKAMTRRMIDKGYRCIVYLAARMDERTKLKISGYEAAMQGADLEPRVYTTEAASSFSLGGQLLNSAREQYPQMDGIICTNDDLAIGALFECQRQGLRVPEDMAIAGFHNHNFAREVVPRIATVDTPREAVGRIAAEQLIDRLNGKRMSKRIYSLDFTVVDGETI